MRPGHETAFSSRRLLAALAVTALLLGPFTAAVYGTGFAQSAMAVAGLGILLAVAIGIAWASARKAGR